MEKPVVTLMDARSYLVRRYRTEGGSRLWPDGIDAMDSAKGEQWYRGHEHEWLDDGTYVGPVSGVSAETVSPAAVSSEGAETVSAVSAEMVCELLEGGLSYREVAARLGISLAKVQRLRAQ